MTRIALFAGVALAVGLAPLPVAAQPVAIAPAAAPVVTALRPDPGVRFGVLPNGMHYAIMRNATPPHNASLRLRIGVGSLYEREDQRGIAHFIEHMAFNGTTHVPKGEFIKRLERAGLKFGPDTNATTQFEQTVYMLDLPETDTATVDTALLLLREAAGEVTFDPAAIEGERGVVLSEERVRATPGFRNAVDQLHYALRGDILPDRLPIGLTDVLKTAPRDRFVEFYNAYYRPERATLVAVGDFDVEAMEAKIRARFGDWKGRGAAGTEVAASKIGDRSPEARVFTEAGVPNQVSIAWVGPPDLRADTAALESEKLVRLLGFQMLNRRLSRLASGSNPPFVGAGIGLQELADRATIVQLAATVQPGGWQKGLAAIDQAQRQAVGAGFTQAELDRAVTEFRAGLTTAAQGAATRQSSAIAGGLVQAVNDREVFTSPADDLALFDATVKGLALAQVNEAFRAQFARSGPLLYLSSPTPVDGGELALRTAYETAHKSALSAAAVEQAKPWPYTGFGTPGRIVERRELPGLGASAIRFANGVRLTVKPTDFAKGEILVTARIGNGLIDLPPARAQDVWAFRSGAFTLGGLGRIDYEYLQQALAARVYGAGFGIGEDALTLSGRTRPEDLATELQVLAAYASDPGYRPTGWNRTRSLAATIHDQLATTPGGVLSRDLGALLRSGDPRWRTPSRDEMEKSSIGAGKAVLAPMLANGAIEIVMVGDVTVEEAARQVAATFGALPPRHGTAPSPAGRRIAFPAPTLVRETHRGRPDQGVAFIAWPTVDFYSDTKRARTLNLLAQVLQLRLIEEIRQKQATTYSPQSGHSTSEVFPGYGYMAAQIEAPPEKLDRFLADAQQIAADLRQRPVSEDELQRAKKPLIENLMRQRAGNAWWLGQLARVQTRPEAARAIASQLAEYQGITAADVQQAARQYLVDAKAWKMEVVPEAKP
ncbi:MAG: insulinase family protein [Alphaproteobacteria bacterium]|nr:insulinase family protein [Alphaproteobacteria bacterium]